MSSTSTLLYYSEPLTPTGRADDWCIDAVSRPPEVLFNFRKVPVPARITDLRHSDVEPTLDGMGFERAVAPTLVDQHALAAKSEEALARYRRETAELLISRTGADEVEFFDATVRREVAGETQEAQNESPHQRVHVDQSAGSALARAQRHRAGRGFSRFQIVNAWRPLLLPVRNFPLAVCDFRSLDLAADLVVTRLDFPEWLKDRENYSVRHNPGHRWYYWGALSPDEVLLFKIHDSASRDLAPDGAADAGLADVAGLCPHTAFFDEDGPTTGHLRVSLEMRALLFYD